MSGALDYHVFIAAYRWARTQLSAVDSLRLARSIACGGLPVATYFTGGVP